MSSCYETGHHFIHVQCRVRVRVRDRTRVLQPYLGELYSVDDSDVQLFHAPVDIAAVTSSADAPSISLDESPTSDSEKAALSALLLEFHDIFSSSKQNTGKCKLVKHYIRTGEQAPIKLRAHRTSPG